MCVRISGFRPSEARPNAAIAAKAPKSAAKLSSQPGVEYRGWLHGSGRRLNPVFLCPPTGGGPEHETNRPPPLPPRVPRPTAERRRRAWEYQVGCAKKGPATPWSGSSRTHSLIVCEKTKGPGFSRERHRARMAPAGVNRERRRVRCRKCKLRSGQREPGVRNPECRQQHPQRITAAHAAGTATAQNRTSNG